MTSNIIFGVALFEVYMGKMYSLLKFLKPYIILKYLLCYFYYFQLHLSCNCKFLEFFKIVDFFVIFVLNLCMGNIFISISGSLVKRFYNFPLHWTQFSFNLYFIVNTFSLFEVWLEYWHSTQIITKQLLIILWGIDWFLLI